jgi:D-sedoheptulose 7-phosphate isomerase
MNSERTALAELVARRIEESAAVKRALLAERELIAAVGEKLIEAYRAGKKLLIFGNGGSASDAQHIAAELVGRYYFDRRALPAEALTVNASSLTAIGNDYSFAQVFARQVEALGNAGDVAVGISTSGNSPNVVEGVRAAKRMGLVTVALTGAGGGRLKDEVDYCVAVPSTDTPRVQEAHALIGHVWCELVERALFGEQNARRD